MSYLQKLFANRKERDDFLIALLVLVFFAFIVFQYGYKKIYTTPETTAVERINIPEVAPTIPLSYYQKEVFYKNLKDRNFVVQSTHNRRFVSDIIVPVNTDSVILKLIEDSETIDSAELILAPNIDTLIQKVQPTSDTPSPMPAAEPTLDSILVEEAETVDISDKTDVVEKDNNNLNSTDCFAIAGVFSSRANAIKFQEQIRAKFPTLRNGSWKNYTFVGIPVICSDSRQHTEVIQKLKSELNVEAWILR